MFGFKSDKKKLEVNNGKKSCMPLGVLVHVSIHCKPGPFLLSLDHFDEEEEEGDRHSSPSRIIRKDKKSGMEVTLTAYRYFLYCVFPLFLSNYSLSLNSEI